jgi:hypothetical protein
VPANASQEMGAGGESVIKEERTGTIVNNEQDSMMKKIELAKEDLKNQTFVK